MKDLSAANVKPAFEWPEPGYHPPATADINNQIEQIQTCLGSGKKKKADVDQLNRALCGLRVALICSTAAAERVPLDEVAKLHGAHWSAMKKQMITNSFRNDVHFLPADAQSEVIAHLGILRRFGFPVSA